MNGLRGTIRAWRLWLVGGAVALALLAAPGTASASGSCNGYMGYHCSGTATDFPAYTGWADINGRLCALSIGTVCDTHVDAWQWTSRGWVRYNAQSAGRVYVWPWGGGWSWIWTQARGWSAIHSTDVLIGFSCSRSTGGAYVASVCQPDS